MFSYGNTDGKWNWLFQRYSSGGPQNKGSGGPVLGQTGMSQSRAGSPALGQRAGYPNDQPLKRYSVRDPNNWGSLEDIQGQFGQFGRDFYNPNWFNTPDVTEWYGKNEKPYRYGGSAADWYEKQTTGPSKYAGEEWERQWQEHMAKKPDVGGTFWDKMFNYQPVSAKWDFLHDATRSSIGGLPLIPTQTYEELTEKDAAEARKKAKSDKKKAEKAKRAGGTSITYNAQAKETNDLRNRLFDMYERATSEEDKSNIAKQINALPSVKVGYDYIGPDGAAGDAATVPDMGTPAPGWAKGMVRDIATTLPQLGNQYRNIANEGMYGVEGMKNILGPLERSQDMILQRLDPYVKMQLGIFDDQTQAAQEQIAVTGAGQRRRAAQGMGDTMARIGINRPGVAAQLQSENMTPFYQDQANRAYGANMSRMGAEQGLRAESEDTYRNIIGQRGASRSGLIQSNLQSKMMGLQGLQGVEGFQADWLGNRGWDLTDPMKNQYSYQAGLMGLGNQFDISKMGYQNTLNKNFAQYQMQLSKELEAWMSNNDLGQYADPKWYEVVMGYLQSAAQTYGNVKKRG